MNTTYIGMYMNDEHMYVQNIHTKFKKTQPFQNFLRIYKEIKQIKKNNRQTKAYSNTN